MFFSSGLTSGPTMHTARTSNFGGLFLLCLTGLFLGASMGCHSRANLPDKNSPEYSKVVSAFYVGLSALQVGDDVHADSRLGEVTQLVPEEPAGWGNWGVLALRQRNYDIASQRLERTRNLAPQNDHIYELQAVLESDRGNSTQAIADLRKCVELNPKNLRATYQLAEEIERQGEENAEGEFEQWMHKILAAQPDNLAALVELSPCGCEAGRRGYAEIGGGAISAHASEWPSEVQSQLSAVEKAVGASDLRAAATQTTFLRNVLMRVPEYRLSLTAIKAPPGEEARRLLISCGWNHLSSSPHQQTWQLHSRPSRSPMMRIPAGSG